MRPGRNLRPVEAAFEFAAQLTAGFAFLNGGAAKGLCLFRDPIGQDGLDLLLVNPMHLQKGIDGAVQLFGGRQQPLGSGATHDLCNGLQADDPGQE